MTRFLCFNLISYDDTLKYGVNQENRAYNRQHLQRLEKQCLTSLEAMPPITINVNTNHIIDGQHRLKAYQTLCENGQLDKDSKIKVMLVDIPVEEEKAAIINANTNSKNWTLDDYISSYAKAGVVYYAKLEEWCLQHSLSCIEGKPKFRYGPQ